MDLRCLIWEPAVGLKSNSRFDPDGKNERTGYSSRRPSKSGHGMSWGPIQAGKHYRHRVAVRFHLKDPLHAEREYLVDIPEVVEAEGIVVCEQVAGGGDIHLRSRLRVAHQRHAYGIALPVSQSIAPLVAVNNLQRRRWAEREYYPPGYLEGIGKSAGILGTVIPHVIGDRHFIIHTELSLGGGLPAGELPAGIFIVRPGQPRFEGHLIPFCRKVNDPPARTQRYQLKIVRNAVPKIKGRCDVPNIAVLPLDGIRPHTKLGFSLRQGDRFPYLGGRWHFFPDRRRRIRQSQKAPKKPHNKAYLVFKAHWRIIYANMRIFNVLKSKKAYIFMFQPSGRLI